MSRSSNKTGLAEAVIPRRLGRWLDRFSNEELDSLTKRLENGNWFSDENELCESRSQAYYRAESLVEALVQRGVEPWRLQRRTWPVGGGTRWAIRLREE